MIVVARARGVALITAMLITAITGSLAAGLAWDNALDVRRTTVSLFHDQATQVALGAETWIRIILQDDVLDGSETDHLGELWASELPGLPVDNDSVQGAVTGEIKDLNSRFNVNNLVDSTGQRDEVVAEQFARLLTALEIDPRFVGLTIDWIDGDQEASFPDGAEDSIYTTMTPAYRSYNDSLSNVSELAALEGMDKETFDKLLPHITALPRGQQHINVNTATPIVLQSLGEQMDAATVETLLEERQEAGFEDYTQSIYPLMDEKLQGQISDVSQYFELKAVVQIDTVRLSYYSVLYRSPNGGLVSTILRSQGTL